MEGKTKAAVEGQRRRILEKWLTPATGDGTAAPGQFADPAAHLKE